MICAPAGHEQRPSAAKEQSQSSSSVPAPPSTHVGRPWCKNSHLLLAGVQKKVAATPRAACLRSCSTRLSRAMRLTREVGVAVACAPDPPFTSPPFTQCYRRGPFWPAYGATARPPLRSERTCDGPLAAPPRRRGPASTPVDAAPRRLPFREDRYSTWGDARAVLPSGKHAAAV